MAMTYPVKIKFTYSANGGSNAPTTFTDTVSTASSYSHAISTSKPTPPSGKYFTRWLVRYNGEIHPQITTNPANHEYISPGGTQSISFPNTYHNSNGREIEMIYYAEYAWNTYAVKYNGNGSTAYPASNVPGQQTKTHGTALTLSSTEPTRTGFTFSGWKDSEGTSYAAGGKYTKDKATTMSAQWKEITYTVSFNAGGGSGQPASQTKYYTSNLTLSTQKPTRTGYSFVNWKASNGTTYNPGGTYSTNASTTMTAQWSELTYTVSYNANNGSGAPASQIKYYTKNLTLQPGVPTRKGYEFLGWATSANATSAAYQPSGTFTTNANTVLYAVWKQVYFAPTITNLTATRAIANGDGTYSDDDEGNIAHVKFNWTPAKYNGADLTSTVYVDISVQGSTTVKNNLITLTPNATEAWITNTDSLLSDEYAYNVVVRFVTDGWDPVTKTTYISQAYYIMDINKDGTSVSIGGASKDGENKFKVFMPSEFNEVVDVNNNINLHGDTGVNILLTEADFSQSDNDVPAIRYPCFNIMDKAGRIGARLEGIINPNGEIGIYMYSRNYNTSGAQIAQNGFGIATKKDGVARTYYTGKINNILWEGILFMTANHTITLSQPIADQAHGIVLCWSAYANSTAYNYDWNYTFIPKQHATAFPDTGVSCPLATLSYGKMATKYVYVGKNGNQIRGHVNNASTGTAASGVKYENNYWVLRRVIGV